MTNYISEGCIRSIQAAAIWNTGNKSEYFLQHPLKHEKEEARDAVKHYTDCVPERQVEKLHCSESLQTEPVCPSGTGRFEVWKLNLI
jgi:hypothetical protein